jgi:UDP-GlcNAc:undecaprenyl-phosphate GlcNAc-1-phosphate transferase
MLLIFLLSLFIVVFSIPPIIKVAFEKRLFDHPTEGRKVHKKIIPNLGGIAIFTAFLFSSSMFIPTSALPHGNLLIGAGLILFMTGLKDDIVGLAPTVKFLAQFLSAFIVALAADLRINNLQGLFGVYELNYYLSIVLSVFFIVGIINAYNLIDGIDGLAGSLGLVFSITYAYIFFKAGDHGWAFLSLSLCGALLGFLFYNLTPAKIFMGDSGSLVTGFLAAIFSLKFLESSAGHVVQVGPVGITLSICLVIAILIIPIFDTLRVFTLRILARKSPFAADSNHVHHRLLFLGLSHVQATFVLALCNVFIIMCTLSLSELTPTQLLLFIIFTVLTMNGLLSLYINRYKKFLLRNSSQSAPVIQEIHFKKENSKAFADEIEGRIFKN